MTNVKAFQAFQILRQGAVILGAILLAHANLSKETIGNFEQLLYIGYSLTFFWISGYVQGLLSSYADYDKKKGAAFLFNAYILFVGISLLAAMVLFGLPNSIFVFFTKGQQLDYYTLFILYLLFNTPTFLIENFLLLKGKFGKIYLFGFFTFFSYLIALLLPVWLGWSFYYSLLGLTITAGVKHLYLVFYVSKNGVFQFNLPLISSWSLLSFPLILYALLGGLMQTFDGWIINFWYDGDPEKFAIFRYGAKELPLVLALAAAFNNSMLPEVRKDLSNALSAIKQKSLRLFHWLFPITILLLAFSNYWYPIVFTHAFSESVVIFDTYLIIATSRLIFSRTVLVGLQDNKMVLLISLIELVINIGLSIWLIQSYGLFGVAFATFLAFSIEKIFLCLYLWYRHGIGLNLYVPKKWWLAYTVVIIFLYFAKNAEYFT